MMRAAIVIPALALAAFAAAWADEKPVTLKPGEGRELVEVNCAACHSLDYPGMNSVFLDQKGWETEVNKMINTYGAPVAPADAKVIIDYLAKNYGKSG